MKAMTLCSKELRIAEVPDPTPQKGQLLVKSLACCICASDLHMYHHAHRLADWSRDYDGPFKFDPDQDIVMGHEWCGEVVDHGPDTSDAFPVGTRVVGQPYLLHDSGFAVIGYSNEWPGGFGEYLAASEMFLAPVPDHVSTAVASLMEPLSVGIQYARIADLREGEVPLVVGCGAIGLAVIAAMKHAGAGQIVAADFSPFRRAMAVQAGATEVVDPREESSVQAWTRVVPRGTKCLIVEAVGAPGVLNELFIEAPFESRLIVAGQNLDDDTFFTAAAHTNGLNVQFGGSPQPGDYAASLESISSGAIDVSYWQTGHVELDEAIDAVHDSTDTETHTRICVHPHGLAAAGL